jgi:hypothetical protein
VVGQLLLSLASPHIQILCLAVSIVSISLERSRRLQVQLILDRQALGIELVLKCWWWW